MSCLMTHVKYTLKNGKLYTCWNLYEIKICSIIYIYYCTDQTFYGFKYEYNTIYILVCKEIIHVLNKALPIVIKIE